ncbi:hypothetical protein HK104_007412, partial [Borealophlyctis nickersoniae]
MYHALAHASEITNWVLSPLYFAIQTPSSQWIYVAVFLGLLVGTLCPTNFMLFYYMHKERGVWSAMKATARHVIPLTISIVLG